MLSPVTRKEKKKAEASIRMVKGDPDTICEHVRVIFHTAETEIQNRVTRNRILEECTIVCAYAKRMNAKLVEYREKNKNESS